MNDESKKRKVRLALLASGGFSFLHGIYGVSAAPGLSGEKTCPDGGLWTKVDSGNLSQYPVDGAIEYCFKAGSENSQGCVGGIFSSWPQPEGTCGLSHWSYKKPKDTATPTDTYTPTPSDTSTFTPSYTPSNTPTPTDTPTITNTPTDGPSPTPSDTPTVTLTQRVSDTPTPSVTASLTSTPYETPEEPTETPSGNDGYIPMAVPNALNVEAQELESIVGQQSMAANIPYAFSPVWSGAEIVLGLAVMVSAIFYKRN